MNDIFDKKDYTYWIIILMIFLVGLSTSEFAHDNTVLNYISFAGTITSILLALIAIVYSYIQNFTNTNLSRQLKESADRIENISSDLGSTLSTIDNAFTSVTKATDNIKGSSENIDRLTSKINTSLESFISSSKELSQQFEVYTSTMQDNMNKNFDETNTKISNMSDILSEFKNTNQININTTTSIINLDEKSISDYVSNTSRAGTICLYIWSKLYANKIKNFSVTNILKTIFEEHNYLYYYGFTICTVGTGLIKFKYSDNRDMVLEVSHFNQILINVINNKLKEIENEDLIKTYMSRIDEYINSHK